jgi:hypothetical protein
MTRIETHLSNVIIAIEILKLVNGMTSDEINTVLINFNRILNTTSKLELTKEQFDDIAKKELHLVA